MGFSASGATAILFVALLVCAGSAYSTMNLAHERVSSATDDRDDRTLDQRNTTISIATLEFADGELTVAVLNVGARTLSVGETTLLVDGEYRSEVGTSVDGDIDRTIWTSGESLELSVTIPGDAPERVKVVTDNGVSAIGEVEG